MFSTQTTFFVEIFTTFEKCFIIKYMLNTNLSKKFLIKNNELIFNLPFNKLKNHLFLLTVNYFVVY